ncbi:MAG: hypothetical protein PHD51_03900 [Patescibacteria group bacterium]|nr:hypothetical protein [Patescibacteria group bacterium]MDD5490887.1 hypothetical protein [Patescibacteria group bacterium]
MAEPRFGENFNPDATNRLDILKKTEDLPEYVDTSREIREALKSTIETRGWPECPEIKTVEDLFLLAKKEVSHRWTEGAQKILCEQTKKWAEEIPDNQENKELRQTLLSPDLLSSEMEMQRFGAMEKLRDINPSAWRTLLLASSERQLASIVLLRKWAADLPEENLKSLGVSRTELELLLDSAGIVGKYVDQAYIKQVELADAPGGSSKSAWAGKVGAEYLYDIQPSPESQTVKPTSYKDVFAFEWPKLINRFQVLAQKVETLLDDKKLPESYRGLPEYLREMSQVYGSESVSPKELKKLWNSLLAKNLNLANAGCPLMFIPQSCDMVAGEAAKIDVEIRLAIQTPETKKLTQTMNDFGGAAQELLAENKDALKNYYDIPAVVINVQPFAFGPNLYYFTEAEAGRESILLHANINQELSSKERIPLLEKTLGQPIDKNKFKEASGKDTVLHELGHTVCVEDDPSVRKRIGTGSDAAIMEELKAETVGMEILLRKQTGDSKEKEQIIEQQFLAKLGALEQYLAYYSSEPGSSTERYYFTGVAIISKLLEEDVLVELGDKYIITDAERGLRIIADMGLDILKKIYANTADQPKKVKEAMKEYVRDVKQKEKTPPVDKFIKNVKKDIRASN